MRSDYLGHFSEHLFNSASVFYILDGPYYSYNYLRSVMMPMRKVNHCTWAAEGSETMHVVSQDSLPSLSLYKIRPLNLHQGR